MPFEAHSTSRPSDFTTLGITNFTLNEALKTTLYPPPATPKQDLRASGPQNRGVEPFTIIEDASAWYGSQLKPEEYIYHLTEGDVAEVDAALAAVEASGVRTADQVTAVTKEDFPLPTFGDKLRELAQQASKGRGFQMIRGVPVHKYNRWQLTLLWWGFGQHIGRVQPINKYGHLINHLHNIGAPTQGVKIRAPNTNLPQNMHSDQFATDLIGLFAISKAKEGGESNWVSSITIHNELLKRGRKDLIEVLTQRNFWMNRSGYEEDAQGFYDNDGKPRYVPVAPFVYHDGRLSVAFQSTGYYQEQEELEVPRLTDLQLEALRTVQALALDPELRIKHSMEPGDIQLLHNPTVMHNRDGFKDGELPHEKRHLLRWWVDSSGEDPEEQRKRPQLACFGERLIDNAGGWPQIPGTPQTVVLDTTDLGGVKYF